MKDYKEIIELENGLNYFKTDLHVHYPNIVKNESEPYEEGVVISDIIQKYITVEYSLISIGNHNSFDAINKLKAYIEANKEALSNKITILPSIELNLSEECHLVIIFPQNMEVEAIRDFLVQNGLETAPSSDYEESETINYFENTKSKPNKKIESILNNCKNKGYIVLAPHARGSKGFFELNFDQQAKIINDDLLNIFDCYEFHRSYLGARKKIAKKMAQINCSDAHKLEKIGEKATWIKMDKPRFKSLQKIIYEPKLRISIGPPEDHCEYQIVGISIDGGMLKDEKIHFNSNYNAIIGGTGSGKSSLIDAIRYVFNEIGYNSKYRKISLKRLKDIHVPGTLFSLYIKIGIKIYKLIREVPTFDDLEQIKEKDIDKYIEGLPEVKLFQKVGEKFQPISLNSEKLFTPVIFGQNELLDYSFDEMDLVKIFNSKIKDSMYSDFIEKMEEIKENVDVIDILESKEQEKIEIADEIKTVEREVEENKQFLEEIHKEFPKLDIYALERDMYSEILKKLNKYIEKLKESLSEIILDTDIIDLDSVENKETFQKINEKIIEIKTIIEKFTNDQNLIEIKIKEIQEIFQNEVKGLYETYELGFKDFCKDKETQDMIEVQEYINKRENLKIQKMSDLKKLNEEISHLQQKKENLFKELEELKIQHEKLFNNWKKYASDFTSMMGGRTKIEIESIVNLEEYTTILRQLGLNSPQIPKITSKYRPVEFYDLHKKGRDAFKKKLKKFPFRETTINKIYGNFSESIQFQLKSCLNSLKVNFFLKINEKFFKIEDLSTGERCATLLNFVFCKSEEPVIVDQPEDNIDYRYIKSTIKILKEQKQTRQFIIVSHNQNLPVLTDADLILTMENLENKKINVKYRGPLENADIYNSILNLEGGKKAFELRGKKYQLIEL